MSVLTPILCLTIVGYLEARGEPDDGMLLVMDVVATRAEQMNMPICDVVSQPNQFYFDPGFRSDTDEWREAFYSAAALVLLGERPRTGATNFHSGPLPDWTNDAEFIGKWGNHMFWRIEP
jgi:spore germination cell wall hydrolase CwlJ-like protein